MSMILDKIRNNIIYPIINSIAPVKEVSWGVAIGTFVGLTPTMGIQMYIVAAIWTIFRYIFKFHFNLPVGIALVWITNPVTVIPIYYLFLITGSAIFEIVGIVSHPLNYVTFKDSFIQISNLDGTWNVIVEGTRFLLIELGLPLLIGGLCYALPSSVIGYYITSSTLTKYRQRKAKLADMSYDEWRALHEKSHSSII
ncbi:MAG: DUF2062 domain-containing protein [SAR324 cluster bacterium]|nr:DUF2062 domain-containing protein [SAR324 cluster bacterium]